MPHAHHRSKPQQREHALGALRDSVTSRTNGGHDSSRASRGGVGNLQRPPAQQKAVSGPIPSSNNTAAAVHRPAGTTPSALAQQMRRAANPPPGPHNRPAPPPQQQQQGWTAMPGGGGRPVQQARVAGANVAQPAPGGSGTLAAGHQHTNTVRGWTAQQALNPSAVSTTTTAPSAPSAAQGAQAPVPGRISGIGVSAVLQSKEQGTERARAVLRQPTTGGPAARNVGFDHGGWDDADFAFSPGLVADPQPAPAQPVVATHTQRTGGVASHSVVAPQLQRSSAMVQPQDSRPSQPYRQAGQAVSLAATSSAPAVKPSPVGVGVTQSTAPAVGVTAAAPPVDAEEQRRLERLRKQQEARMKWEQKRQTSAGSSGGTATASTAPLQGAQQLQQAPPHAAGQQPLGLHASGTARATLAPGLPAPANSAASRISQRPPLPRQGMRVTGGAVPATGVVARGGGMSAGSGNTGARAANRAPAVDLCLSLDVSDDSDAEVCLTCGCWIQCTIYLSFTRYGPQSVVCDDGRFHHIIVSRKRQHMLMTRPFCCRVGRGRHPPRSARRDRSAQPQPPGPPPRRARW